MHHICKRWHKLKPTARKKRAKKIHTSSLMNLVKTYYCSECDDVQAVRNAVNKINGQAVLIQLICENCDAVASETFSSPQVNENKKTGFDVNKKFVDAFLKIGSGYNGLLSFCATMSINPMSNGTYYQKLLKIKNEAALLKKTALEKSREIVRQAHRNLDVGKSKKNSIDILVSYDGSWHNVVIRLYTV